VFVRLTAAEGEATVGKELHHTDSIIIVRPKGRLSLVEGQELLSAIFLEVSRLPRDVIVDLSGVDDMSSWGFALMCGLARKLSQTGRSLRIAGPKPFVRKYIELFTGLKQPVEFHDSAQEAMRAAVTEETRRRRRTRRPSDRFKA